MWHFGGVTMDFSSVKWHFRSRKHTLFLQKTLLFPPKNILSDGPKHTIGCPQTGFRPTEKTYSVLFFSPFNLFTKGTCQQKRPSDFFLSIFRYNLRHFVLYKNDTFPLTFPHFSARGLAFFRKNPYLGRKKNSLWPNLNYRIYRTANRPCCTRN